jgi:hypothetical protein
MTCLRTAHGISISTEQTANNYLSGFEDKGIARLKKFATQQRDAGLGLRDPQRSELGVWPPRAVAGYGDRHHRSEKGSGFVWQH